MKEEEHLAKYPIGGFAPGNYWCTCTTCLDKFSGDKRAIQCEPCALKTAPMNEATKELTLADEEWISLIVRGIESSYLINKSGQIKNSSGKQLKYAISRGYKKVGITINGNQYNLSVHRLLAESFIPNPNNLPQVNHIDGNKLNNDLSNLEWCNGAHNAIHAFQNGLRTSPKGEKHWLTKLNNKEVLEIAEMINKGHRNGEICNKYNVNHRVISNIRRGIQWSHLTGFNKQK